MPAACDVMQQTLDEEGRRETLLKLYNATAVPSFSVAVNPGVHVKDIKIHFRLQKCGF
jgi:hypothetical protein